MRELLYEQGFTISGARNKLDSRMANGNGDPFADLALGLPPLEVDTIAIRNELSDILNLLKPAASA
jgi:hypothetical protein